MNLRSHIRQWAQLCESDEFRYDSRKKFLENDDDSENDSNSDDDSEIEDTNPEDIFKNIEKMREYIDSHKNEKPSYLDVVISRLRLNMIRKNDGIEKGEYITKKEYEKLSDQQKQEIHDGMVLLYMSDVGTKNQNFELKDLDKKSKLIADIDEKTMKGKSEGGKKVFLNTIFHNFLKIDNEKASVQNIQVFPDMQSAKDYIKSNMDKFQKIFNVPYDKIMQIDSSSPEFPSQIKKVDPDAVMFQCKIFKGTPKTDQEKKADKDENASGHGKTKFLKKDGQTKLPREWADELGISYQMFLKGLKNGTIEGFEVVGEPYFKHDGEIKSASEWAKQFGTKDGNGKKNTSYKNLIDQIKNGSLKDFEQVDNPNGEDDGKLADDTSYSSVQKNVVLTFIIYTAEKSVPPESWMDGLADAILFNNLSQEERRQYYDKKAKLKKNSQSDWDLALAAAPKINSYYKAHIKDFEDIEKAEKEKKAQADAASQSTSDWDYGFDDDDVDADINDIKNGGPSDVDLDYTNDVATATDDDLENLEKQLTGKSDEKYWNSVKNSKSKNKSSSKKTKNDKDYSYDDINKDQDEIDAERDEELAKKAQDDSTFDSGAPSDDEQPEDTDGRETDTNGDESHSRTAGQSSAWSHTKDDEKRERAERAERDKNTTISLHGVPLSKKQFQKVQKLLQTPDGRKMLSNADKVREWKSKNK